jgi:predicted component of type VI protein secretion system
MLPQELRQFAERLHPDQASRLFDFLIDAMPNDEILDPERESRIWQMVKSIMADDTAT